MRLMKLKLRMVYQSLN
ncbi:hypothetical protein Nmel_018896 [Mimus melanotis]